MRSEFKPQYYQKRGEAKRECRGCRPSLSWSVPGPEPEFPWCGPDLSAAVFALCLASERLGPRSPLEAAGGMEFHCDTSRFLS
jgi:hypothetical protein